MSEFKIVAQVATDEWFLEIAKHLNVTAKTVGIVYRGLSEFADLCFYRADSAGWWTDMKTGESLIGKRNKPEMMMLMVSEISEMMEGTRKGLPDDKLPWRKMEEVELGDLMIRAGDYSGAHKLDLAGAILEKMAYNAQRADHKIENRKLEGGKQF